VAVHDLGRDHGGIVTFTVAGRTPAQVRDALWSRQVAVAVCPPNASRLDLPARGLADGVVRASPHYFVTADEVRRFLAEVGELSG
jgi:cysteine desulfurase / selenocysteine lyase